MSQQAWQLILLRTGNLTASSAHIPQIPLLSESSGTAAAPCSNMSAAGADALADAGAAKASHCIFDPKAPAGYERRAVRRALSGAAHAVAKSISQPVNAAMSSNLRLFMRDPAEAPVVSCSRGDSHAAAFVV